MIDFILENINKYQDILIWLGIISIFLFIASLILTPQFIKKMPSDYFINSNYHLIKINSVSQFLVFMLKNITGLALIVAGIIMLFTPGQGIIAIIIGLFLIQFKGKYKLEQKLISNDLTFKTLNWIRTKMGVDNFQRLEKI